MAVQRIERGDLWKSKAKALSLRLRDRFRVVVDRRRRKQPMLFADDGYFSTVDRLLRRFRDFRRDSLPSTSAFYRKGGLVSIFVSCFWKLQVGFFHFALTYWQLYICIYGFMCLCSKTERYDLSVIWMLLFPFVVWSLVGIVKVLDLVFGGAEFAFFLAIFGFWVELN
jgi:hypothetical protein